MRGNPKYTPCYGKVVPVLAVKALGRGDVAPCILLLSLLLKWMLNEGKIERRIEVTERRRRRRKQLLDDLAETRGYWKLEQEALDHTVENSLWKRLRTCRETNSRMNEC
jgi:hypothetical protein